MNSDCAWHSVRAEAGSSSSFSKRQCCWHWRAWQSAWLPHFLSDGRCRTCSMEWASSILVRSLQSHLFYLPHPFSPVGCPLDVQPLLNPCKPYAPNSAQRRKEFMLLQSTMQDVRYTVRQWRRAPGFALTVVAVLALGLGANIAVFTLLSGILLRPLPYTHPDRIVSVELGGPM